MGTDHPTNRRMNKMGCKVVCMQLKIFVFMIFFPPNKVKGYSQLLQYIAPNRARSSKF